ncbi:unnamed protein product [Caenorhabditis angaria]|uniref:LysM domain-containing protein n=1 Tax=Caenorhabditis angaria TaxID=860376 RepID=A0A9P1IUB3_9PELO|nr:unnamed protein product [Caenorhabditis angaria]
MEYTISEHDTLERVAASHDCTVGELMKLNKMASRMVFPGQKILVPISNSDDVFEPPSASSAAVKKGPGGAVPAHIRRGSFNNKTMSAPVPRDSSDEVDTDCLQRFLKIKVKQVTESDGTVSGTLLVTPNCLMFDPDVSHPLVKENGPDLYGMVANMDEIMAVSVYKEIGGLTGDRAEKKRDIFDPDHVRTTQEQQQTRPIEIPAGNVIFQTGEDSHSPKVGSESTLPSITEESGAQPLVHLSGALHAIRAGTEEDLRVKTRSRTSSQNSNEERPRSYSELDAPPPDGKIGRFSPNAARRSFGKLGRTLSARAKSIQGTVTSGTKTVVTHTKSAADTLTTGIENGVKVVGEQAKAAADVAGRVVDRGQSLMNDSINGVQEIFSVPEFENSNQPQKSSMVMKREQSLAKLQDLRRQTAEFREISVKENKTSLFSCATSTDEMPDLFSSADQLLERNQSSGDSPPPVLPFYMAVRLTRTKRRKSRKSSPTSYYSTSDEDCAFGNKLKREFWFAIPRTRADNIYHFLLQWSPDKYGLDATNNSENPTQTSTDPIMISENGHEKGFIVLDASADESLSG